MIKGQPKATEPKTERLDEAATRHRRRRARPEIDRLTTPYDVPAPLVAALVKIGYLTDPPPQNPVVVKAVLDACLRVFLNKYGKDRHRQKRSK